MYATGVRRAPIPVETTPPTTKKMQSGKKGQGVVSEFEFLRDSPEVISQNLDKWIAVIGKEIVASGDTAKEVIDRAFALHPDSEPFVAKFPRATVMLL